MIGEIAIRKKKIRRHRIPDWIRHYAKKMRDGKIRHRKDRTKQKIDDHVIVRKKVGDGKR